MRPTYGEGREVGISSDNTIIMKQFGLTKSKSRREPSSDLQAYAEMAKSNSLAPNASHLYDQLIQNEEHESDDKESANRVKTSDKESKVLQNISDIGNFSAIYLN